MDEVEVYNTINKLRTKLQELDNAPLQEVFDSLLDLIEAAHSRITDIADDEDLDE